MEAEGDWFDRETLGALAEANLLGLAVPEAQGGMGMGFLELCLLLLKRSDARSAPLPALPALVLAGSPSRASAATDPAGERWLAPLASGEIAS